MANKPLLPFLGALLILCRQRIFRERVGRMGRMRSWGIPSCMNKSRLSSYTSHTSHTSPSSPTFFSDDNKFTLPPGRG